MVATMDPPRRDTIDFEARSVTGLQRFDVSDVQADAPAGAVATALAERMELPRNVPWTLRAGSRLLVDDEPIGRQIEPNERVTVTPRAHLG